MYLSRANLRRFKRLEIATGGFGRGKLHRSDETEIWSRMHFSESRYNFGISVCGCFSCASRFRPLVCARYLFGSRQNLMKSATVEQWTRNTDILDDRNLRSQMHFSEFPEITRNPHLFRPPCLSKQPNCHTSPNNRTGRQTTKVAG